MSGAIKSVMDGKLGVDRAADQYGVPRTTLKDRLSGRVIQGTNPGPMHQKRTNYSNTCSLALKLAILRLNVRL